MGISAIKSKRRTDWRLGYLGVGLHDLALENVPQLTRGTFGTELKDYLRERSSPLVLERRLIDSLYKKVYHGLQLLEAVPILRKHVGSQDWQRRSKTLRDLTRDLASTEQKFAEYRSSKKLPLTSQLVRSIAGRMKAFSRSLREELGVAARLTANEKKVLSGYLKPELKSQLMLDIENHLIHKLPSLEVDDRILIVAGCAAVARLIESKQDEKSAHEAIYMRIRRARQANRRDSIKE